MSNYKRHLQVFGALAALVTLALAVSCTGFFQNPTLTGLTIGPATPTLDQGTTLQMTAVGTYSDGSEKTLTSGVFWSSDTDTVATVTTGGLISAVSPGTATITASSQAVSGTTSVTVVLGDVSSITVTPSSQSIIQGQSTTFDATARLSNGTTTDITTTATWVASIGGTESTDVTCSNSGTAPETCTADTAATPGSYTITVSYGGTTVTGTATLNVAAAP